MFCLYIWLSVQVTGYSWKDFWKKTTQRPVWIRAGRRAGDLPLAQTSVDGRVFCSWRFWVGGQGANTWCIMILLLPVFLTWVIFFEKRKWWALLDSTRSWLKKLNISVFSQNHTNRISKAPSSNIYPSFGFFFKFWILISYSVCRGGKGGRSRGIFLSALTWDPNLPLVPLSV